MAKKDEPTELIIDTSSPEKLNLNAQRTLRVKYGVTFQSENMEDQIQLIIYCSNPDMSWEEAGEFSISDIKEAAPELFEEDESE